MHSAQTTPQASVVTVDLASMEMESTVYQMVGALPLTYITYFFIIKITFLNVV